MIAERVLCQHSSMRHCLAGVDSVYFHDHLMTGLKGTMGGEKEEGGRELFCLFFHALSLTWVFEIIFTLVNIVCTKCWDTKAKEGKR